MGFCNSEMICFGSISQPFQACGCIGVNPEHAHLGLAWIPWKKNRPRVVQQILSMQCSMPRKTHPWPSHCFCRSHCHRISTLAMPGVVGPMGKHAASCIANGAGDPRGKGWKKTNYIKLWIIFGYFGQATILEIWPKRQTKNQNSLVVSSPWILEPV